KLREKIAKFEKHLKHFRPDTVHLQVALERHPQKVLHTAALTLRLPSNILRSEKFAPDVIKTFDDAVKALLRELESLKADLRGECPRRWQRRGPSRCGLSGQDSGAVGLAGRVLPPYSRGPPPPATRQFNFSGFRPTLATARRAASFTMSQASSAPLGMSPAS